jgi:hypothetical protein
MAEKTKKLLDASPWKPVPFTEADVAAIQALNAGKANEGQQRHALEWIINVVAGSYDQSYRPGSEGDRDTAFAEGRRFVGLSLVKAIKYPISLLRSNK